MSYFPSVISFLNPTQINLNPRSLQQSLQMFQHRERNNLTDSVTRSGQLYGGTSPCEETKVI